MTDSPSPRGRAFLARLAFVVGGSCLVFGAVGSTLSHSTFNARVFGNRAASSLDDPGVSAFVADRITTEVLRQSPDLIAVRPLILVTVRELIALEPMRALVRTAARSSHQAVFAEGTRRIALSVPDVGVLLKGALERASPDVAAGIPENFRTGLASIGQGPATSFILKAWQLRSLMAWLIRGFLVIGVLLVAAGVMLATNRYRGLVGAGMVLLAAGLAVASLRPLGTLAIGSAIEDQLVRGAAQGLWHVFLSDLATWGILLGGLGLVLGAAGSSVLEEFTPMSWLRQRARAMAEPATKRRQVARAVVLVGMGVFAVWQPGLTLRALVVVAGLTVSLIGVRELFLLAIATEPSDDPVTVLTGSGKALLITAVATVSMVALVAVWLLLRSPALPPVSTLVSGCNGHLELCARPVNDVVFPGAHNAMSNAEIEDWMFPHHQRNIQHQLRDGVRAFLLDVHYGFPGGARIKTDLGGMRQTMDAVEQAVGAEGMAAAERIREQLVGVDEGKRGLYLCHGFCELGAYELTPTLAVIRQFLVRDPGAVLILVIEDYVTPEDLAKAFEDSRLDEFVYQGAGSPWPTLGTLVMSGQRVLVFLESGTPGVPWIRPAFTHVQETPYTFHEPAEFTCRANRGGTDGELFQINHWIETTPAPRPSNAEVVNAYDALMGRARACRQERGMIPNIIAVDFYRTGELFRVVNELNGVGAE